MIELLIAAWFAFEVAKTVMPPAYTGTYQISADKDGMIRTDTRTGAMERCTVSGDAVTCVPLTQGVPK